MERCAKTGKECDGWKNEINGEQIDVENEADHALGGMTTLNNVPTLFLPLYDSNGPNGYDEKWTDVFQFKDYKWERIEKLNNSDYMQTSFGNYNVHSSSIDLRHLNIDIEEPGSPEITGNLNMPR